MSVTINSPAAALTRAEIEAWKDIPVSIAVDLEPSRQTDYAIRPRRRVLQLCA